MQIYFQQTNLGKLGIAEENGSICEVYFEGDKTPDDAVIGETALLKQAFSELNAYLAGELKVFTLPLAPHGTAFRQTVWKALCDVPYGQTASYKDIAVAIGNPKACRAVGQANNKNPIPVFIPCHRIIGADGKMVGYGGGLHIKEKLLDLEKHHATL